MNPILHVKTETRGQITSHSVSNLTYLYNKNIILGMYIKKKKETGVGFMYTVHKSLDEKNKNKTPYIYYECKDINPTEMFNKLAGTGSGAHHTFLDAIVCQYRSCRKVISPS